VKILNENQVAFIISSTTENIPAATIETINQLEVPENFSVEIVRAEGEEKFQAYDIAMKKSDAKYKIYLDENVSILQKNILSEIISAFKSDEKIGVIGFSGAIQLSTHGICLQSAKRVGKFFASSEKLLQDSGGDEKLTEVESVDDFFLATQYDITWREDLFKDNYFGFAAQCLEFRRKGYKSVVLQQDEPCVWIREANLSIGRQYQKIFLEEYKEIFPLVTVIIPTFNRTKFFQEALESVLNQTYRNFEIVVSDDSTTDDTEKFIQPYLEKYPCIKYFRHKNFTANDNWNFLRHYNNPDAEFVNWLMDDDLFYPTKLERMVEVFRNIPTVSIVTSVRDIIDGNRKIVAKAQNAHPEIFNRDMLVEGEDAGRLIFEWGIQNYIGEPTTAMIRKKCLRDNDLCWTDEENGFFVLIDMATWLQLFTQGDLFYIASESLSAFRQHGEQQTNATNMKIIFAIGMAQLIKTAVDKKIFLNDEKLRRKVIIDWLNFANFQLLNAHSVNYYDKSIDTLAKTMAAVVQSLYNGGEINLPPRDYGDKTRRGQIS